MPLVAAMIAASASAARAQLTLAPLYPQTPYSYVIAYDADGGRQVGTANFGNTNRAFMWAGAASSAVDLHALQAGSAVLDSHARAVSSSQQVGYTRVPPSSGFTYHAAVWRGTAASWVDLHPSGVGATFSVAYDAWNGRQVGGANVPIGGGLIRSHAGMWRGSASSWVDLHPLDPRAVNSFASGIHGAQQVGRVDVVFGASSSLRHAALWYGNAESWVDLHPANAAPGADGASESYCQDVHAGRQVGVVFLLVAELSTYRARASLWRGTAASWVNLHPASAEFSEAHATHAGRQVGYIRPHGLSQNHAVMWRGTADSCVDLNTWLPTQGVNLTGWLLQSAEGISGDGTQIVGKGIFEGETVGFVLSGFPAACPADLDSDGLFSNGGTPDSAVTIDDLLFMLAAFEAGDLQADLDDDGEPAVGAPDGAVTIDDLLFFLARFEQGC